MKNQNFVFRLLAVIISLLVIGIIGFYFFTKNPVNFAGNKSQTSAAVFISKLAPATVSLLVNPDDLDNLTKLGKFSEIKNRLLVDTNIDYREDIQPWLSNEITLSVTSIDLDHNPDNGLQPGYLMALSTAKLEKSREFIELLFSQRALEGANLEISQYKGIKLISDYPDKSLQGKIKNSLAGAVVNNFVLFANDAKVIREAINNLQAPDLNLSSSLEYQKAVKEVPENALAIAFFNLPSLAKWQGLEFVETNSIYNSELVSLVVNNRDFLVESTFLNNSGVTSISLPMTKSLGALKYIPESAKLVITSTNLSHLGDSDLAKLWKQGITTIYGNEENIAFRVFQSLEKLQTSVKLNLVKDIFSWVEKEYAIALLPNSWIFVVEKTPQLISGIARLDEIANAQGLNVSAVNLGEQKISAWTELKATNLEDKSINVDTKIRGLHTTIDNYEIFTSDLKTLQTIMSQEEKTLLQNQEFTKSMRMLPQSNQGYIYIDWQKSQDILEKELPILKFLELLGKPLFENLRSLTISSYSSTPEILKGGLFFHFND